jgi:8-oxo-dGTP pyrophosphatase MutT (NUDIX family)
MQEGKELEFDQPAGEDIGMPGVEDDRNFSGLGGLKSQSRGRFNDPNISVSIARQALTESGVPRTGYVELQTGVHVIIKRDSLVYVTQEHEGKPLTLPGGKNERDELANEALVRELKEEGFIGEIPMDVVATYQYNISYEIVKDVLYVSFYRIVEPTPGLLKGKWVEPNDPRCAEWVQRVANDSANPMPAVGRFVRPRSITSKPYQNEEDMQRGFERVLKPGGMKARTKAANRIAVSLMSERDFLKTLDESTRTNAMKIIEEGGRDVFQRMKFVAFSLPRDQRMRIQLTDAGYGYDHGGTLRFIVRELGTGTYALKGNFNRAAIGKLVRLNLVVIAKDLSESTLGTRIDRPTIYTAMPLLVRLLKRSRFVSPASLASAPSLVEGTEKQAHKEFLDQVVEELEDDRS